ncbi:uroporphyrinogen-III C-methyltransferase [Anaerovorax sp. IOR16]|uniref:uroporphyrinogen-III C-methyltransferase n=1 Tax=Anaerovorax sp. IOR16 TaxID=2773458 RepID=UPI001FD6E0D1|nr:uroporphyrinogen-III C-methyltransferase [Anaerovorax sp. IOR16]
MDKKINRQNAMDNERIAGGKVWLVGAGPSDAGLFTLRGKAVLEQADVVVYDKLVGQGVLGLIPSGVELIPVGKVSGYHPTPQYRINEILLEEALKGKKVVRLKGGDPFVFGRGGEELELLCEHDIPFEIVPGITSAISVPAYNGIPVTHRDFCSSLHIITGHTKKLEEAEVDYEALVKVGGTMIFLMGVSAMPKICKGLLDAGMRKNMPAAILERGTTAHQRRVVSDLTNLPKDAEKAGIQTPAIIVVGEVCSLADQFHWAEDRPLGGLKIAVTRPKDRNSTLASMLSNLGAEVVLLPTIETEAILENTALRENLEKIHQYKWVAFTSPAGVKVFYDEMRKMHMDIRSLSGLKFAVIGAGTRKAVEEKGIIVDLMPDVYSGEALGQALAIQLKKEEKEGKKPSLLLPRARIGTEEVTRPMDEAGISYTDLPIYETIDMESNGMVTYDDSVDYVAFTSASTVRGFVKMHPDIDYTKVEAVCIGEQTAAQAESFNMKITIAEKATMESMVECFLRRKEGMKS